MYDYSALTVSSSALLASSKRCYFDDFERNINTGNGAVTDLDYIFADGHLVALVRTSGGSKTSYGVLTDRLGSLMSLYNSGGIVQKFSYDAWGNRRHSLTGVALSSAELADANSITSCGYTGHEHIDEFGLINMNARIYDSKIGMFISVDPQAGSYPGTYPYTYCGGDPMNRVDPTGEDYWSTSDPNAIYEFWKHYNENKGISGYGFDGWYQMSNKEFLAAYEAYGADALTYNDQTATLYSYEGKVENGQVVIYGRKIELYKTLYQPIGENELQSTGEPPLPRLSAFKWVPLWKSAKNLFKAKNAIRSFRSIITFGQNENQVYHTFRHIDQLGLSRDVVTKTIMKDIAKKTTEIVEGKPFNQRIEIMGHRLQYTAYKLGNGKINIGRIYQIE